MHPREIPETLVLPVPLFDGWAEFIGGANVSGSEAICSADEHPVFGLAVFIAFAVHHRGERHGTLTPTQQAAAEAEQSLRRRRHRGGRRFGGGRLGLALCVGP